VLVEDLGVIAGNRVLLRGPNNPMMVAAWFAVLKAGAIAVTTMPLLRPRELSYVLTKARVTVALCDGRFAEEMQVAAEQVRQGDSGLEPRVCLFHAGDEPDTLEALSVDKPETFANVATAIDDVALIAFTSGSTGRRRGRCISIEMYWRSATASRGTSSNRRRTMSSAARRRSASPSRSAGSSSSPSGSARSSVLIEQPSPAGLLDCIQQHRATILFTAPTMYRRLAGMVGDYEIASLRKCVSAGETLPLPTYNSWLEATGIKN